MPFWAWGVQPGTSRVTIPIFFSGPDLNGPLKKNLSETYQPGFCLSGSRPQAQLSHCEVPKFTEKLGIHTFLDGFEPPTQGQTLISTDFSSQVTCLGDILGEFTGRADPPHRRCISAVFGGGGLSGPPHPFQGYVSGRYAV
jgi:hypothetical protein